MESNAFSKILLASFFGTALVSLPATSTLAWEYHEHAFVAERALLSACEESTISENVRDTFCTSKAAFCYGHMVALAGDHVASFSEMAQSRTSGKEKDKWILKDANEGIDCTSLESLQSHLPFFSGAEEEGKISLKKSPWILAQYDWLKLLPENESHFQPQAIERWEYFLRSTNHEIERSWYSALAAHAFSMHHLQDAFASGHNGLNRENYLHEVNNAFHDDLNGHGTFFKDGQGNRWHSYGDGHMPLDHQKERKNRWKTLSLFYASESDCITIDEWSELRSTLQSNEFVGSNIRSIDSDEWDTLNECPVNGPMYLSLSRTSTGILDLCFFLKTCEKVEVTLSHPSTYISNYEDDCYRIASNDKFYACTSTYRYVQEASTANAKALLELINASDQGVELEHHSWLKVRSHFPTENVSILYESGKIAQNSQSLVIQHSDYKSISTEFEYDFAYQQYSLAVEHRVSDLNILDEQTLNLAYKTYIADFFDPEPGVVTRNYRTTSKIRGDIFDTRGRALNGLSFGFGYELNRPSWLNKAIGWSIGLEFGVDEIWSDGDKRSFFYGLDTELSFFAGKKVVFIEFGPKWYDTDNNATELAFQFLIGYGETSISLATPSN